MKLCGPTKLEKIASNDALLRKYPGSKKLSSACVADTGLQRSDFTVTTRRGSVSPRAQTSPAPGVLLDWEAGYAAQQDEATYELLEIEGSVPQPLRDGTLFRNGPGKFEVGGRQYAHRLDGDGYVVSFAFDAVGRVHFTGRFVQTREKMKEDRAKKVLFRSAFGTQKLGWLRNAFDMRLKNPANTNAIVWGGRLLALWEAGAPFRLDPDTLETRWEHETMGGHISAGIAPTSTGIPALDRVMRYGEACTAHPHIAPAPLSEPHGFGGERLVVWTWQSVINAATLGTSVRMKIVELDERWRVTALKTMAMENGLLNCHDFSVSDSSYVFFQSATRFEMAHYVLGLKSTAQCMSLVDGPTKVHVVSRTGIGHQVFTAPPGIMLHHANAYDDGHAVVVWSSGAGPAAMRRLREGKRAAGNMRLDSFGDFSAMPHTSLWQHRMDKRTGEVAVEALLDGFCLDFPCINPRFYSRQARYVFFTAARQHSFASAPLQAFGRLDTVSKEVQWWDAGPRSFCGELVFVPGEKEGDECSGFLLGMVFYAELQRSALLVMDASDFSKGPVTRIWTKQPLAHGLHGTFTPHYHGNRPHRPSRTALETEGLVDSPGQKLAGQGHDPASWLPDADPSMPEGPLPDSIH